MARFRRRRKRRRCCKRLRSTRRLVNRTRQRPRRRPLQRLQPQHRLRPRRQPQPRPRPPSPRPVQPARVGLRQLTRRRAPAAQCSLRPPSPPPPRHRKRQPRIRRQLVRVARIRLASDNATNYLLKNRLRFVWLSRFFMCRAPQRKAQPMLGLVITTVRGSGLSWLWAETYITVFVAGLKTPPH